MNNSLSSLQIDFPPILAYLINLILFLKRLLSTSLEIIYKISAPKNLIIYTLLLLTRLCRKDSILCCLCCGWYNHLKLKINFPSFFKHLLVNLYSSDSSRFLLKKLILLFLIEKEKCMKKVQLVSSTHKNIFIAICSNATMYVRYS